jgi:hypothetical protein
MKGKVVNDEWQPSCLLPVFGNFNNRFQAAGSLGKLKN